MGDARHSRTNCQGHCTIFHVLLQHVICLSDASHPCGTGLCLSYPAGPHITVPCSNHKIDVSSPSCMATKNHHVTGAGAAHQPSFWHDIPKKGSVFFRGYPFFWKGQPHIFFLGCFSSGVAQKRHTLWPEPPASIRGLDRSRPLTFNLREHLRLPRAKKTNARRKRPALGASGGFSPQVTRPRNTHWLEFGSILPRGHPKQNNIKCVLSFGSFSSTTNE